MSVEARTMTAPVAPRRSDRQAGGRAEALMQAWVVREPFGIDALAVETRPVPEPGPSQVLVCMRAVSLNYRDLHVINGKWRPAGARVPASEGVGIVVAAGAQVSRVAVGERVAALFFPCWLDGEIAPEKARGALGGTGADGLLSEYVVLDADAVVRVPAHLSDAEAATLPCAALTAWHAIVERGGVSAGDTVLVQGTGGVSLFALQFARVLGARVIATSSSDDKLRRARELGASEVVNYRETPAWDERVRELTGGRGVDHVIETVGGANLDRSLRALRMGGSVRFIGMLAGERATVDTFLLAEKNVRLHGVLVGSRAMFERMNGAIVASHLTPEVDRVFPFDELPAAMRHAASGAQFGKVCVAF